MNIQIDPTAVVDVGATIGDGTRVWHFSHICTGSLIGENCTIGQGVYIGPGVRVGNNVKIQNNVSLYERAIVEDDVFLGPSCVFTNVPNPRAGVDRGQFFEKVWVQRGASIGANVTLVCDVIIGKHALIAAGAVVVKYVQNYALVAGVPTKRIGWVSRLGFPLKFGPELRAVCPESGLKYELIMVGKRDLVNSSYVRALDLGDDEPLPDEFRIAKGKYSTIKWKGGCFV